MTHSVYLFNWQAFRRTANPFVRAIDQGDFTPLLDQARSLAERFQAEPETWLFDWPATPKPQAIPASADRLKPQIVDFCFLLLLATFLRPCPGGPGERWREISGLVSSFYANPRVGRLLTCGWSTLTLLRPEQKPEPASDSTGWLDLSTIQLLQERLHHLKPLPGGMFWFDPQRAAPPFSQPQNSLPARPAPFSAYAGVAKMLTAAIEAGSGLLFRFRY